MTSNTSRKLWRKRMIVQRKQESFTVMDYLTFSVATCFALMLCICLGSTSIPLLEVFSVIWRALSGSADATGVYDAIILYIRLPRVISTALVGSSLSLCGAAMQGLLRNPLAEGSTLGVSAGAALGAVTALAFGLTLPALPFAGTTVFAMLFAFISLVIILLLAYRFDNALSTNTIILIGVIFGMFASSILSLLITFSGEHLKPIVFWTMGSLSGSNYANVLMLLITLLVCGTWVLLHADELNAFAIGEENARHIGVPIRRVKLGTMIVCATLIGVSVSIGGSIGFVGLVVPHAARIVVGPNHKKLLPASLFSGAIFLVLCDLLCRTLLNPLELPIGVVTSFLGSISFVTIFYHARRREAK